MLLAGPGNAISVGMAVGALGAAVGIGATAAAIGGRIQARDLEPPPSAAP